MTSVSVGVVEDAGAVELVVAVTTASASCFVMTRFWRWVEVGKRWAAPFALRSHLAGQIRPRPQ
jgi:hypothetical protein